MSDQSGKMKRAAGHEALRFVEDSEVLGVGSGSTVGFFIEELAASAVRPRATVATSRQTARQLSHAGFEVVALDRAGPISVYVDGADEVDPHGRMIKGAGGAHAAEKRVASASGMFVCIVDETKIVRALGERAPVPLEVLDPYLESVADAVGALGGALSVRSAWRSDDGNALADVSGLDLSDPALTEDTLEALPGVVACGVFAHRRADVVIVGTARGTARVMRPAERT